MSDHLMGEEKPIMSSRRKLLFCVIAMLLGAGICNAAEDEATASKTPTIDDARGKPVSLYEVFLDRINVRLRLKEEFADDIRDDTRTNRAIGLLASRLDFEDEGEKEFFKYFLASASHKVREPPLAKPHMVFFPPVPATHITVITFMNIEGRSEAALQLRGTLIKESDKRRQILKKSTEDAWNLYVSAVEESHFSSPESSWPARRDGADIDIVALRKETISNSHVFSTTRYPLFSPRPEDTLSRDMVENGVKEISWTITREPTGKITVKETLSTD